MLRFLFLTLTLSPSLALAQGAYSVRTNRLHDHDVSDSFCIGDVVFIVRRSAIWGGKPIERDIAKLLPASRAVDAGDPSADFGKLIDLVLKHHHEPSLTSASAVNFGDQGFIWHVKWDLFPSPGGFTGIPFQYHAYVRPDGSVITPELFLCDSYSFDVFEEQKTLFSTVAFTDMYTPENRRERIDVNQAEEIAVATLATALKKHKIETKFRVVGTSHPRFPKYLFGQRRPPDDVRLFCVNFVESDTLAEVEELIEPFSVWVSQAGTPASITYGFWAPKSQITK